MKTSICHSKIIGEYFSRDTILIMNNQGLTHDDDFELGGEVVGVVLLLDDDDGVRCVFGAIILLYKALSCPRS